LRPSDTFARLSINDARDVPTVHMGYGQDVPILYASLGVRRIAALAYMLSWAWREHLIASKQLGQIPSSRIVLLFDEIEAHLHPRWQRFTSSIEDRNCYLSKRHHDLRELSEKKLTCLTHLHSFYARRSNGTTAASREEIFERL